MLPFPEADLKLALAIERGHAEGFEEIGIQRRDGDRDGGDEEQFAIFGGEFGAAEEDGVGAIDAEDDPAEEEAAVGIGPEEEHGREKPHVAAVFENGEGGGGEEEGEQERTVGDVAVGDGGGGNGGGDGPIKAVRAAEGDEAGERADADEHEGAEGDEAGEAAGGVGEIEDDLGEPLMGEVEVADHGLVGVGRAGVFGGEGEGVGVGEMAGLEDVLAGFEVPPGVAIGDFGAEPDEEERGGEEDDGGLEPRGDDERGRGGDGGRSGERGFEFGGAARGAVGHGKAHFSSGGVEGASLRGPAWGLGA